MKRTLVMIAGASVLASFLLATPAAAAEPVAGCGKGLTLATVQEAIDAVDWSIYAPDQIPPIKAAIAGVDANTDGHVCVRQFKPSNGRDNHWGGVNYVVTGISENNARGQIG